MNWPQEIAKLVYIKQALADADKRGLWPHHLPAVAATTERLACAEKRLDCQLDPEYAEFLRYADGWRGFYQTVDLFGTAELCGGEAMDAALLMLNAIDDGVLATANIPRQGLQPIAAAVSDRDLFVIAPGSSSGSGAVLWFAGELIDRFESFNEFFLAMMDYNREEVFRLRQRE